MRVGIFSDIHGNDHALRAVIDRLQGEQCDQLVCLGDICATGPQPGQALQLIRDIGCPVVQGNTDAWLADPQPVPNDSMEWQRWEAIDRWCATQLSTDDLRFLSSLPSSHLVRLDEQQSLLCFHGSPGSFDDIITATTPGEALDELFGSNGEAIMAGGHTHMQLIRRHRSSILLNPGSVGLAIDAVPPADSIRNAPWAEYAIIYVTDDELRVELRRIAFDVEALIFDALRSGMPYADWWAAAWRRD